MILIGGEDLSVTHPSPEIGITPDLRVLDGVASWCGGLHGSMPLSDALKALARGLDADAAAISRHYHRSEELPRSVAIFSDGERRGPARSYCGDVLGYQLGRARAGTVWFLSDFLDDPAWCSTDALECLMANGNVREIAVMPMSVTPQSIDYVEFHFDTTLPRSVLIDIEALVPTIERSWRGRKPGLVTGAIADDRAPMARRSWDGLDWDVPILGMSNPAGLSRAEFRVCVLLSRGLSVKAVSDELGLSDNTVRSHLRAIYAKTETSSLPELIYRIMSGGSEDDSQLYAQRRA